MRSGSAMIAAALACMVPAALAQGPAMQTDGHWSYLERLDRTSGQVRHFLVSDGSIADPSQMPGDHNPTLLLSCDPGQSRRIYMDFGVTLYDGEITLSFDGTPGQSRTWARSGHTTVRMDDAGLQARPTPAWLVQYNLHNTALLQDNLQDIDLTVTGADGLVHQMAAAHTLTVQVQPNLPSPMVVAFPLDGLESEMAAHGCPVGTRPVPRVQVAATR